MAYKLARLFNVAPMQFLELPLDELKQHWWWANKMMAATK